MKKMLVLVTALMLATFAVAQQPSKALKEEPKKADKAPTIPTELRAKIFKIQAQQLQAQIALKNAEDAMTAKNQEWQQVGAEVTAACGDKFAAQWDAKGDPTCVPKPESAKAPEKK